MGAAVAFASIMAQAQYEVAAGTGGATTDVQRNGQATIGKNLPPEIVVTAGRSGNAAVESQTEIGEDEIAGYGATSILDLLSRLQPVIDPTGDEPLILINGKPAGFDRSILTYPSEALSRLTVLKPEAGAHYGATSDKRVVNLVLKKKFASIDADAGINTATAGGQYGGNHAIVRSAISGDTRWIAQARIDLESALFKSARRISPDSGPFDAVGYVAGVNGGEVDPALSRLNGSVVGFAAIPPAATSPSLGDFEAMANRRNPVDPNRYETLQPSVRSAALGIGITRPIGDFSVSLTIDASRRDSGGLNGLPMVALVLPPGSRWSPFAGPVMLERPFDGTEALRTRNSDQLLATSLSATGIVHGVQSSLAVSFSHDESRDRVETGVSGTRLQQMIDAGDAELNPYGGLDRSLLEVRRDRSRADNISGRATLQKNLLKLPAGPLGWAFSATTDLALSNTVQSDDATSARLSARSTHRQSTGQISLNLPVSRRGSAFGTLGDLAIDFRMGRQSLTGSTGQTSVGGGITWSPIGPIQLHGSVDRAQTAPSLDQLDGPVVTTITRVFDYARQEFAEPSWTTGGNPQLRHGSQASLSLSMMLRPLAKPVLTINLGYRRLTASGSPIAFPELTPAVETAFPERVTRDADGRLIAIDARPINIEKQKDATLNSNLVLRFSGPKRPIADVHTGVLPDPVQINLSVNFRLRLQSEILIRHGIPVINRLNDMGGARREVSLQLNIGKRAFGGSMNTSWRSDSYVDNASGDFRLRPPLMFDLSAFVEPSRVFGRHGSKARGVKIDLNLHNVFNGYRHVTLPDGSVPAGYSRDQADPLGRTVTVTVRKRL